MRLISEEGEKLGIVDIQDALAMAKERELDLVEVAPNAEPPVCRIANFKKMQYEKRRKRKEAKKHQRNTETKEVKLRPNIGEHDYQTKLNHARSFLKKGHKVKATLIFRQREMRRYDIGMSVVNRLVEDVKDLASRENPGRTQMRTIVVQLAPNKEIMLEVEKLHKEEIERKRVEHEKMLQRKHPEYVREQESSEPAPEGDGQQ